MHCSGLYLLCVQLMTPTMLSLPSLFLWSYHRPELMLSHFNVYHTAELLHPFQWNYRFTITGVCATMWQARPRRVSQCLNGTQWPTFIYLATNFVFSGIALVATVHCFQPFGSLWYGSLLFHSFLHAVSSLKVNLLVSYVVRWAGRLCVCVCVFRSKKV